MVYGSFEQYPGQYGERGEVVDETAADIAARRLLDVIPAALHLDVSDGLTDTVLRTIGNNLASYGFSMGGERWDRRMEALRVAAVAYVDEHPEADALLFNPKCPF